MTQADNLQAYCRSIRRDVIDLCSRTKSPHVGSSLSVVEILAVLYECVMRVDPKNEERDRLILSKGHACPALYAVLGRKGVLPKERLDTFATDGCALGHHPHYEPAIGLEANAGSLGHGLPIGCGLALAARMTGSAARTFVVQSDGECNEGTVWEAAGFAGHHKLNNLCMVLDANGLQAMGPVVDVMDPISHARKWEAFGWEVIEVDGHDTESLRNAFNEVGNTAKPLAVIAKTVKGKGVSFMEHSVLWHYRPPLGEELVAALKELEA